MTRDEEGKLNIATFVATGAERIGGAATTAVGICRRFHNGSVHQHTMGGITQRGELRRGEESPTHGTAATENRHWHINVRVYVEFHDVEHATGAGVFATGHGQPDQYATPGSGGDVCANDRFK